MSIHSNGAPHDAEAEQAVLAGATIWPQNVDRLLTTLTSADFYSPRNQRWYLAIHALHGRGESLAVPGLVDELRHLDEADASWLVAALADHSVDRNITGAARVVNEMSLRRRLLVEAGHVAKGAGDLALDPYDVLDVTRSSLGGIDLPLEKRGHDEESLEDFLSRSMGEPTPWLVPGLLRQGWRTVVVAREGQGKTWLLRQVAVCCAYGIHPMRFKPIDPVRTLLVDLENPEDHLYHSLNLLVTQAKRSQSGDAAPAHLWRRPGGIDLRRRADRADIESLLTRRRPQLLVIGPLYKSYRVRSADSWDLVASEVQEILDDWRFRFNLTLMIEDHAPKGQDLVPFGSSLWLRWPDIGLTLVPKGDSELDIGRFRGDRMPTDWPEQLVRAQVWPWEGRWRRQPEAF